jgi:sterol desaturase/sphingolipid hydroxylase (fatty acid hydroxylase superfamily)
MIRLGDLIAKAGEKAVWRRHANNNFAVMHFFWDRVLGTYRRPDAGQTQTDGTFGSARSASINRCASH